MQPSSQRRSTWAGGAREDEGGAVGRSRWCRMSSITSGCVMTLRMRNELPHRGHCVTSTAKTRSSEKPSASMRGWAALIRVFGFWILAPREALFRHREQMDNTVASTLAGPLLPTRSRSAGLVSTCRHGHARRSDPEAPDRATREPAPRRARRQSRAQLSRPSSPNARGGCCRAMLTATHSLRRPLFVLRGVGLRGTIGGFSSCVSVHGSSGSDTSHSAMTSKRPKNRRPRLPILPCLHSSGR
jgi:hypothetical protein